MSLYWNPWILPFCLLSIGEIFLGVIVYRARPNRFQNRLLGFSLVVWGIAWAFAGTRFVMADPGDFQAGFVVAQVGWLVYWAFYLAFLGTLDSPLSRPWSTRTGRWALGVGAVAGSAFFLTPAGELTAGVWPGDIGRFTTATTPLGTAWWVLTGTLAVYTLLVGVSYLRRTTPGTPARSEAKAFVAAFAARDVIYIFAIFGIYLALDAPLGKLLWAFALMGEGSFALLLTYGILKHQLLGLDVKIKLTLKQSTVAAIFIAVFFIVSEGAAAAFEAQTGSTVAGILAAGALVFVIAPLYSLAERVADKAMPGVKPVGEMNEHERRTLYHQQALAAWGNGTIDRSERVLLDKLREGLGLSGEDAARIEREAAGEGP